MIEILFFGRLGDASQTLRVELVEGVSDTDGLTAWLSAQDGDEIAFMSPLSGG